MAVTFVAAKIAAPACAPTAFKTVTAAEPETLTAVSASTKASLIWSAVPLTVIAPVTSTTPAVLPAMPDRSVATTAPVSDNSTV